MLIKNGDVESLANAIEQVIEDSSLRKTFRSNSLNSVYQYDIQSIAKRYINIF
jgi:glycosyltransferase involved in cell wall biosynthesis